MAIRFVIGLYALVALAVLVLAACGGGDGGDATESPAPPGSNELSCFEGVRISGNGITETSTLGSVIEVVRSSGTEPGFENMTVGARVDDSVIQVVLLGDLITEVDVGDCVEFVGAEQRWACGPDCEDFGFVASFFEVLEE